jgi:hypothetical protein
MDDETYGTCLRRGKLFEIRINSSINEDMAIESLIHEYAHALSWSHLNDKMEEEELSWHGPAWGVAYSQVYQVYECFITQYNKSLE